jgi:hypothetical protein
MHIGSITREIKTFRPKYLPGIGDLPSIAGFALQTLERYQCEHCEKIHEVLGLATEPFYCSNCNHLIEVKNA